MSRTARWGLALLAACTVLALVWVAVGRLDDEPKSARSSQDMPANVPPPLPRPGLVITVHSEPEVPEEGASSATASVGGSAPQPSASEKNALQVAELASQLRSDPGAATGLLRKLQGDPLAPERTLWATALALEAPGPLAGALRGMITSGSGESRSAARDLLQAVPLPSETLASLGRELLETQGDPDAVSAGLAALKTAAETSEDSASARDSQLFYRYAKDPNPQVRAEGIAGLAHADRSGNVEPTLRAALDDPAQEVQLAAMEAIVDAGLRSDDLKSRIIGLLLDANADFEVRAMALNALGSFRLTPQEQAKVAEVRRSMS